MIVKNVKIIMSPVVIFAVTAVVMVWMGGVDMRSTGSCYDKHFILCLSKARCPAC